MTLRAVIIPEEPFPAFSGLKRKIVIFSLKFLPALTRTREENKSMRNGAKKSIRDIIIYSMNHA